MGQPRHNPQPGVGTAQVDVRHVRQIEAEEYQRIIAQLILDKAVLQVALNDQAEQIAELEAKVQALSGMGSGLAPAPPATSS